MNARKETLKTLISRFFICAAMVLFCGLFTGQMNAFAGTKNNTQTKENVQTKASVQAKNDTQAKESTQIKSNTKTDENVQSQSSTNGYVLTLIERGDIKESINGSDIKFNGTSFDDSLLRQKINNLSCFDESKIIESKNPKLQYSNGSYIVKKEIYGTRVNKDALYNQVVNAIKNKVATLNLDSTGCYVDPTYTSTSAKVTQARDLANKYVSTNIEYSYGYQTKYLNGSILKDWIYINGDFDVTLLESKSQDFVSKMAGDYTYSLGRTTAVYGGSSGNNHGWVIDTATETTSLINAIKSGYSGIKYPAYSETRAASYLSSVGDTYVEVDMDQQYLWFYKDGYIVAEGDVVTGNLSQDGCATPAGVYSLNNKQADTNLVGPNYVSPVSFWMPFIGNSIGLHDASWRADGAFGGDIYKTNGSHGCVNLPYYLAHEIYDNISVGTPVICYY